MGSLAQPSLVSDSEPGGPACWGLCRCEQGGMLWEGGQAAECPGCRDHGRL